MADVDTSHPPDLSGHVALVTGASRGVGRGIAVGLGEAGATVYVTGRTHRGVPHPWGGSIEETAAEVTAAGGRGLAHGCDHTDDAAVAAVFDRIDADTGRLDVLVNNVWGGYETFLEPAGDQQWFAPFWEQPLAVFDRVHAAGVRAHFTASRLGARRMVAARRGLLVTVSFWAAQRYMNNVAYGYAKAADDTMTRDMAHELRDHGVSCVSLYPGLVRTESVLANAEFFDLSNSESPQLQGRAVAHLAADPDIGRHSGGVLVTAQVALDYGFTDVDGRQPVPLTLETA